MAIPDFAGEAAGYAAKARRFFKWQLRIKTKQSGYFRQPQLADPQMRAIGEAMITAQKARWSVAKDAYGNPAPKLKTRYAIVKQKVTGKRAIRDNVLTGMLSSNFTLRKASGRLIRAENTAKQARDHARRAQGYAEMIGFAPDDQNVVFQAANSQYGVYLKRGWVTVRD